jgi:hypothetical protein
MSKYRYFISYNHKSDNITGSGCCEVERSRKIKEWQDVVGIQNLLQDKFGFDEVVIINWKKF